MNYASRYRNTALSQQSYLPFKVVPPPPLSERHISPLLSWQPSARPCACRPSVLAALMHDQPLVVLQLQVFPQFAAHAVADACSGCGWQVNATGVMPVIFSSTLLSLPTGLAGYAPWLEPVAAALGPTGLLYLPVRGQGFLGFRVQRPSPHDADGDGGTSA